MIKVATRDSDLSIAQTKALIDDFKRITNEVFEILPMKTAGDQNLDDRFDKIGQKGVFTKELDQAILDGRADIAIHSLKDVPSVFPESISLVAAGLKKDVRDVLVSEKYSKLDDMPKGAKVGTSSARRVAQLRKYYPNIDPVPIRGNLQTRLKKMHEQDLDGIILAASGMMRMGYAEKIASFLPVEKFVPAIGQGYLAVTAKNHSKLSFLLDWQDQNLWQEIASLRYVMSVLDGGCSIPLGMCWEKDSGTDMLHAFLSNRDASSVIAHKIGFEKNYQHVVVQMVEYLRNQGAEKLIEDVHNGC
ncbi:MAG: hydroxymethylbilane synthase [Bdellovibrionota bacterium]